MNWILFTFFALTLVTLSSSENSEDNLVVEPEPHVFETKDGPVQGTVVKLEDGQIIDALYGIPYARPPVGDLRFRPPQKVAPWTSVLQATKHLPTCYQQIPYEGKFVKMMRSFFFRPWSEDCLHLNIWTARRSPGKVPVIFYIHGGGFFMGSSLHVTDGSRLASEGTVVVSINYRLGVFGFLSMAIPEAPGNVGLMDQTLALQWIRDNAEVFGGDPDRITIVGVSAGGASVGYHLLSPMSSGLFKRAISMSGVPTNLWAVAEPEKIVKKAKGLTEVLGCAKPEVKDALECLKQRHPDDLIDMSRTKFMDFYDNFVPTVDGQFITEHPSVSIHAGRFNRADVIIGTTSDEASMLMLVYNENLFKTTDGRLFRRDFIKVIRKVDPSLSIKQLKTLAILYTNSSSSPDDPIMLRDAARNIYSDGFFDCHINEFAEKMSATANHVYRYIFDYKMPPVGPFNAPDYVGTQHGSDHLPILGPSMLYKLFTEVSPKALDVFQRFRKHVESFATNGDPNLDKEEYPDEPEWPVFDSDKKALHFGETSSVKTIRRLQECAAWTKLIPLLDNQSCNV